MNYEPLNHLHGAPLRLRVENQLGFKMVKWIQAIEFVEDVQVDRQGRRRLRRGPRVLRRAGQHLTRAGLVADVFEYGGWVPTPAMTPGHHMWT